MLFRFYHAGHETRIHCLNSEKKLTLITDTLAPSFDQLANALRRFYDLDRIARIEEHQLRTGMDWLTYLPRVYYSGGEQLGVSLDLGGVFRYVRDQRRDDATIQSLNQKSALSYEDALYRLKSMLYDLQSRMNDYNRQLEIFFLKERAFRISEQAYKSRELPPAEFLARQIQFEQDKSALTGIEQDIERITLLIYEHTRYSLPDRP